MLIAGRRPDPGERGVASVEMVLVLPLLIVLVMGIVEASWAIAQQNAVRGVAREGARVAATHPELDTPGIAAMVCDGLDILGPATLEATGTGSFTYPGAEAFFEVVADYNPLTGFFPIFNGLQISSRTEFVVEVYPDPVSAPFWWPASGSNATC